VDSVSPHPEKLKKKVLVYTPRVHPMIGYIGKYIMNCGNIIGGVEDGLRKNDKKLQQYMPLTLPSWNTF
jgi:hypothetical protein